MLSGFPDGTGDIECGSGFPAAMVNLAAGKPLPQRVFQLELGLSR